MRGVVVVGLVLVAGMVVGAGCGGTSTGGRETDGAAGTATGSGGAVASGVGGASGSASPSSGGASPSSGGTPGAGGSGTGGAPTATVEDLCPEIVAAGCAALAAYLPDEATCVAALPMLAGLCQPATDNLLTCTGPDPRITCNAAGAPTSAGCETEWGAVMACVAQLMGGAGG